MIQTVLPTLNKGILVLHLKNLINRAVALCPISYYPEWLQKKRWGYVFVWTLIGIFVFQYYPFILLISEFHFAMFILSWKLIISVEWVVRAVLQEFSKQSLYLKWSIYNSVEENEFHCFEKIPFWYDSWSWWQLQSSDVLATDMGIYLKITASLVCWIKGTYNNN